MTPKIKPEEQLLILIFQKDCATFLEESFKFTSINMDAGMALLLDQTLKGAGLFIEETVQLGNFKNGFFVIRIMDAAAAVRTLAEILDKLKCRPVATLYWFEPSEHLLRRYYPMPGEDLRLEQLVEQVPAMKAFQKFFAANGIPFRFEPPAVPKK